MKRKQHIALLLTGAILLSSMLPFAPSQEMQAARKPRLSAKKVTITKGKTKTVSLKGISAKKIKKVTWKTDKKRVAAVKRKGTCSAKITGKNVGKAVVTAKIRLKKTKKPVVLKLKVTVQKKKSKKPMSTTPARTSSAPAVQTPCGIIPTPLPSQTPPAILTTPSPSHTPAPEEPVRTPESILEAYDGIFEYMGTCANYYGYGVKKDQLRNQSTLNFIKKQFNSITLENEMKPDPVLGRYSTTGYKVKKLTVAQAKAKGYYIPDTYTETYVPELDLGTVDSTLETLEKEGLKMRAHTFVWHQQTPPWFFTKNYDGETAVDVATMDARLEFFIRTVMRHVMDKEKELTGTNGTLVYAWDVVNEYIHRFHDAGAKSWTDVYGDMGLEPSYIKRAFEIAYEELERYGVQDTVALYYNDYDTYDCADDIVRLINFINNEEMDSTGKPVNICNGIGMQSHVTVGAVSVADYGAALDKFLATGLEVSITELDASINYAKTGEKDDYGYDKWAYTNLGQTAEDQADYMKQLMETIVSRQKNRDISVNPKGIVSVTVWGLFDGCSWKANTEPLLFGDSINDPKPSYYAFLKASDIWYKN